MSVYNAGLPNRGATTTSSVSRWITNPKHLSAISGDQASFVLCTAPAAYANSTTAGFFTSLAKRGATAAITVANTYVTVCNIGGAGFLVNCVSPTHTAAFTPTIRITADGVVYTIAPTAPQPLASRVFLGALTVTAVLPGNASDAGFNAAMVGGIAQAGAAGISTIFLMTPEQALMYDFPVLRFETSLLVEMKCDLLSGTANDKSCGVTYKLDM